MTVSRTPAQVTFPSLVWTGTKWVSESGPDLQSLGPVGTNVNLWLVRSGTAILEGAGGPRFRTTGYNSYVMRSAGGTNAQTMTTDQRTAFMSSLRPGSLLRAWAFCPQPNTYPTSDVLAEQDAIVASARQYGHRLIFTLADWWGAANDGTGVKTTSWLSDRLYNGAYRTWLDTIVARYANEPTVAVWDLLNEPEVPNNTSDLVAFVNTMGARVKQLAPHALVSLGINTPTISTGSVANYQSVYASTYLDFCSFHDYAEFPAVSTSFPGVLSVARALGKPILVDEVGVYGGTGYQPSRVSPAGFGAVSTAAQTAILGEKLRQYATHDEVVGALLWSAMRGGIEDPAFEPPVVSPVHAVVRNLDAAKSGFNSGSVAGLEAWFRATDAWRSPDGGTARIYKHGAASGSFGNPLLLSRHSVAHGKPAWECGQDRRLWTDLRAGASQQTWFAVIHPTQLTAGLSHHVVGADARGGLGVYIDGTSRKVTLYVNGAGVVGTSTSPVPLNVASVVEVDYDVSDGTWQIWLNRTQVGGGRRVMALASSNTVIGSKSSWQAGGEFTGYLYELLKYTRRLPSADAAVVRNYLLTEYGL